MSAISGTKEPKLLTLGGLELSASSFKRAKPLLMLAYLCLEGPQTRRRLADLFWPEAKDPLASLSVELSRLKRAGDVVGADNAQVWATVGTDAQTVLEALGRGEWQEATEAYGGPFLSGVYTDWSAELEEWVYSTREYLAGRVGEAHLGLGEAAAAEGDFGAGAGHAQKAYTVLDDGGGLEPDLAPRVYALLAADGHPLAAEVRRSAHEVGLDLNLTAAEARAQLRPTAPRLLTRGTSFVGRGAELETVDNLFRGGEVRLLSLVGLAGMGKTRLAVEAANRLIQQGRFRDGVRLVELESLASPHEFLYRLAATLDVELRGDAPVEAIAEAVKDQSMLLILDSFERLVEAVTVLPELLERLPNLALLVTSRERLNLAEEHVLWLEGLSFEDAAPYPDALTLFIDRAKRHRHGFDPSEENLSAVARICRMVGGSPLATELAAALVNVLSCEGIAEHLEQDLISLSGGARGLPERHSSLRAAFESSWRLLSEDEQGALMKLAVFRGGFTREAAQAVAGVGLTHLVALNDKALLRPQPNGRYDRHPLLHEFTKQKLAAQPELEQKAQQAHAAYFTSFLEERFETIQGEGAKVVLNEVGSELDNVRSAWRYQLGQRHAAELARGVFTLAYLFEFSGRAQEGLDLFDHAAQRLTSQLDLRADLQIDLQPGYLLALGNLRYASSWMLYYLGQAERALHLAEEALAQLRAHGDPNLVAMGLSNLAGFVADYRGDYRRVVGLLEEAYSLPHRDLNSEAVLLGNLANAQLCLGDYAAAEKYLAQARQLNQEIGSQVGVAICLLNQANLFMLVGRLAQAELDLKEVSALSEALNLAHFQPYLRWGLAQLRRLQGDIDEAYEQIASALELARHIDDQQGLLYLLVEYARIELTRGEREGALKRLNEALTVALEGKMLAKTLHALTGFSEVLLALGEHALASRLSRYVIRHQASFASNRDLAQGVLRAVSTDEGGPGSEDDGESVTLESLLSDLPKASAAE